MALRVKFKNQITSKINKNIIEVHKNMCYNNFSVCEKLVNKNI